MSINGLDISGYQEQPDYGKLINWPALKADPFNFRFIWIKCAEGTDGTGYVLNAARQVAGARSVRFEAINPYHFYYFQWFSTSANRWYTLSATDQARAFRNGAQDTGMLICHPMTDIEDPLTGQFLVWSDTASANAALAFARRLNAHLKAYHEEVARLFGVKPDIYTGAWWWNRMAGLLLTSVPEECAWWEDYKFILADYVGGLDLPMGIRSEQVIAWQFTSTPIPPVQGIPTGHAIPGDALDCDRWLQSEAEFLAWSGQTGGSTMASIFNQQTPQDKRAKVLTLENDQRIQTGYGAANLGIDAVILPMGGMSNWDGSHWKTLTESTFAGRFDLFAAANIPVLGRFELDAGSMIAEQHGDAEFIGREPEDNFILPRLFDAWHIGSWTWDILHAHQGKWRPISALILSEVKQTPYKFVPPNDYWQTLIWNYVVEHLRTLMMRGQIPTVPIIMYSGGWWLRQYPGEMAQELQNDKDWLYLHLGHWVRTSTNTFDTLAEIFAFPPDDSFTFALTNPSWNVPDGYAQRVLLHEFTGEAQKCRQIIDAAGNPTAVNLSLWNDTKEAMLAFLKYGEEPEPGNPCAEQEAYITELLDQIAGLQAQISSMETDLAVKELQLTNWATWLAGAPR